MKYTVEGFSQSEACKFKDKIEIKKGNKVKLVEIKIDCTDLVILRWIVDFYPSMIKLNFDNKEYVWINYNTLLKEMPLLDIKKQALADRLQKLCHFKILERKTIKQGGTFSYYSFGENYDKLIRSTTEGECSQLHEGTQSTTEGECSQLQNKDSSISNSSIKYSFKESKKEENAKEDKSNKKNKSDNSNSYEQLINEFTDDEVIKETIYDFIKMRKLIKAPVTDRALKSVLKQLNKLSKDKEKQIQILEQSIRNNWRDVFPLREERQSNKHGKSAFDEALDEIELELNGKNNNLF